MLKCCLQLRLLPMHSVPHHHCYLNCIFFAADSDSHTDDSDIRLNILREVENPKWSQSYRAGYKCIAQRSMQRSLLVTLVAAYNGIETTVLEAIVSAAAKGTCRNTFHQKFRNMLLLCRLYLTTKAKCQSFFCNDCNTTGEALSTSWL